MLSLYPYEPQHAQEQHSFNGSSECEHIKIPQTNRRTNPVFIQTHLMCMNQALFLGTYSDFSIQCITTIY